MIPRAGMRSDLGRGIAAVLRAGTVAAVMVIGIGFVAAVLAGGAAPGAQPVVEVLVSGGWDALIAAGLLGLTLIPVAVLVVGAVGFAQTGEHARLWTSLVVLGLLVASLVAAALLGRAG